MDGSPKSTPSGDARCPNTIAASFSNSDSEPPRSLLAPPSAGAGTGKVFEVPAAAVVAAPVAAVVVVAGVAVVVGVAVPVRGGLSAVVAVVEEAAVVVGSLAVVVGAAVVVGLLAVVWARRS